MMPMKTVAWRPAAEDLMPSADPHFQVLVTPQSVLESRILEIEIAVSTTVLKFDTNEESLQEQAGMHIHVFLENSQIARLSDTPSIHALYAVMSVLEQVPGGVAWRLVSAFATAFALAPASACWRFASAFVSAFGSAPVTTDDAIN